MISELKAYYGNFFETTLIEEISSIAVFKQIKEDEDLIRPGQYIKSMPLLLSGSIKILRPDENGDELFLYHLERGDTCAMTLTCCLGKTKSEIHAVAEMPTKLLMVPVEKMEEWSSKYKSWRNFVYISYHERMMELLESIDNIAFNNMDERLAKYLKDKTETLNNKRIRSTHREIAQDLHTSRVVISRLLKKMERNQKIRLYRNSIEVL